VAKIYESLRIPSARDKNQCRDALAAYRGVLEAQFVYLCFPINGCKAIVLI